MATTQIREFLLVSLFEEFLQASKTGRRLKRDGGALSKGTIESYGWVLREVKLFEEKTGQKIRLRIINKLNARQLAIEKRYWERFYRKYTDYLYAKGSFDNYVGVHIKVLKTFFAYLKTEKLMAIGDFYKGFYVRSENVPIIVFTQDQLKYLISNEAFEERLPPHLRRTKDLVVFGSTVGLRYSDLIKLTKRNIEKVNGASYLKVRSRKTKTETVIKLPDYAIQITRKYRHFPTILPVISKARMNKNIKELCERAGWNQAVGKSRARKGLARNVMLEGEQARFCDLVTTHTMRKTAITTLLILGVPEQVVRKISGHAPGSKEFFRYVHYSQHYIDSATDSAFDRLQE